MGWFDFKKKAEEEKIDCKFSLRSDVVEKILSEMKRRTKCDCERIEIKEGTTSILNSKIGGMPYWPKEKEYPRNEEGKPLVLLAQINCEDLISEYFPIGILQFYIDSNDLYGLSFEGKKDGYAIVYHSTIEESCSKEELELQGICFNTNMDSNAYFPTTKEYILSFVKDEDYMGYTVNGFSEMVCSIIKELYHKVIDPESFFRLLDEKDYKLLCEAISNEGHKMFGYPYFTQHDCRKEEDYILLLQIDSDSKDGKDILWGDSGVAHFFIREKDLKNKDFKDVLYNWDCF